MLYDRGDRLGVYAVSTSGAGDIAMAMVGAKRIEIKKKARAALDELGFDGWRIKMLEIDNHGAQLF